MTFALVCVGYLALAWGALQVGDWIARLNLARVEREDQAIRASECFDFNKEC